MPSLGWFGGLGRFLVKVFDSDYLPPVPSEPLDKLARSQSRIKALVRVQIQEVKEPRRDDVLDLSVVVAASNGHRNLRPRRWAAVRGREALPASHRTKPVVS
jgi:hypothetical protein